LCGFLCPFPDWVGRSVFIATGTVKWLNDSKGFGFMTPTDGGKDVFVHFNALSSAGLKSLPEGATVEFETEEGPKAPQAKTVNERKRR
jgi:cold shock protein